MKKRLILICVLIWASLLSGCGQNNTQEVPETPALQAESLPEETAVPTEPAPLYPPAPVIEYDQLEHAAGREEASVQTSETFSELADGSKIRCYTEYANDQNGKPLEERSYTYDAAGTLLSALIRKYDEAGKIWDREYISYGTDGSICNGDYIIYDAADRELLKREYAYEEDGSPLYDLYYSNEYDAGGNTVRTLQSQHSGDVHTTTEVLYDVERQVTKRSLWEFAENGQLKFWHYLAKTADGATLEEHRLQFDENGTLRLQMLHRYTEDGALLEMKELRCYESGAVEYDFYELYTEDGIQLENSRLQYRENGEIYFLHRQINDETGKEMLFHHEQYFDDGALEQKHLNEYDENHQLRKSEYLSYYTAGVPASIFYSEYDADGKLLKRDSTEYNADGSICSESKYPVEGTEFVPTKKSTFHANGNPEYFYDGLYHTNGMLMEGKAERHYENGQLWIFEEASFDEATRTRTSSETRYLEDGTVDIAWQRTEVFDEAWRHITYDSMSLGSDLTVEYHEILLYTYDANGNVLTQDSTTYDGSGAVTHRSMREFAYDGRGNITLENNITLTADEKPEHRMEQRYTYSDEGKLVGKELAQYDADDALTYHNTEEYDNAGLLLRRTTDLAKSRTIEEYTYHTDGKMHTLLTTIIPQETKKEPVIQYRKVTEEYYENGVKKSQTIQTWTSKDEEKAAPGTPQEQLGKTTVTRYDESGNRI